MKNRTNFFADLYGSDIVSFVSNLFSEGYSIDPEKGKIASVRREQRIDHPWIHIRPDGTDAACISHRCLFFSLLGKGKAFVPTHCLQCWKVVVRPMTVEQLFNLLDVMEELQYRSKCGLEERDTVHGNYGGYFYCRSKEEGLARRAEVKPIIEKRVGHVPIFLKRFCTEFEMNLCPGASSKYQQPEWAKAVEEQFYAVFETPKESQEQPDFLKNHIKARWIIKAWGLGDNTVKNLNDGRPLYPAYETYN